MTIKIDNEVNKISKNIIEWRRHIHTYPELGMELPKPAEFVAEKLSTWGIDVQTEIGISGVVGKIKGSESGPTIALRADMDALPMQETSNVPYRSKHQNIMHACGHDGHTAMLLGAAKVLSQNKEFNATIIDDSNNYSLLAIQGPKAIDYCQNFTNVDLNSMKNFSHSISTFANCNNILLSKTGYTGSGGLEIYIPNEYVVDIWDHLFEFNKNKTLMPIGLAARDTLRIEMGYCLY